MKATFKSNDPMEIKQLAKAGDMAAFIWELKHNSWREFKHQDYDYTPYLVKIITMLEEHKIDIDDLCV